MTLDRFTPGAGLHFCEHCSLSHDPCCPECPCRAPLCGIDFCEECGDCLSCYGNDDCVDGKAHTNPPSLP